MKFVVPLTIPCRRSTWAAASVSCSTRMTGTTPATAASKRSCTPFSRAHDHSSSPWRLSSCLFAVTTWRAAALAPPPPRRHRAQHVVARRVEAAHDLDDEVRALEDVGEVAAAAGQDAADLGAQPGERGDLVGTVFEQPGERAADRAVAEQADAERAGRLRHRGP